MSQTEVQLIKDLAVVTGDIADQAVTLDKLPHGTSSNDGKFLRANNGADPTFETVDTSTIPVTDESSDTTCFPIFVTAATGDLASLRAMALPPPAPFPRLRHDTGASRG